MPDSSDCSSIHLSFKLPATFFNMPIIVLHSLRRLRTVCIHRILFFIFEILSVYISFYSLRSPFSCWPLISFKSILYRNVKSSIWFSREIMITQELLSNLWQYSPIRQQVPLIHCFSFTFCGLLPSLKSPVWKHYLQLFW